MAMVHTDLAEDLKSSLGFGAEVTSTKTIDLAKSVVDHAKTAVISHAPGELTGDAPSAGGPLTNGAGSGGTIVLDPSDLETRLIAAFGISTPEITGMANAITDHLVLGTIAFSTGLVVGVCTNTASSPGPLTGGAATSGLITLLPAATLAANIASAMGQGSTSPELLAFCAALVDYIEINSETSYSAGSIIGTCPSGGGPVPDLAGAGGSMV